MGVSEDYADTLLGSYDTSQKFFEDLGFLSLYIIHKIDPWDLESVLGKDNEGLRSLNTALNTALSITILGISQYIVTMAIKVP